MSAPVADDVRAIEQLKYRYFRMLDLKQWAGFEDCFVPEATADFAGLAFATAAEAAAFMRENLGPRMITVHHGHHPEIAVDGDSATGTWYLDDRVLMPDHGLVLEGAAFYDDHYVRTPSGWRIARTGYRRTYELTRPLTETDNLRIGTAYGESA